MNLGNTFLFALLLTAPSLYAQTSGSPAQTWFTVTPESSTVTVVLPAGTTYRFGDYANNRWSTTVTVNAPTTISPVSMSAGDPFPFSDPDYGTAKELDVLETSAHQLVSVTDSAASPVATTSLVVPPLIPPTAVPTLPGTSYTLTFSNFSIAPGTPQNSLMLAFVNAPSTGANRTWEGTNVNLTIDGVTMVCTYSQNYTDQVFSLNCTVPTTTP
jgi:hypothetical protein